MVERGGLENRCAFAGTEGSNPSPSAIYRRPCDILLSWVDGSFVDKAAFGRTSAPESFRRNQPTLNSRSNSLVPFRENEMTRVF